MTALDEGSISSGTLRRAFGNVSCTGSESSNHANETTVPAPAKTEGQSLHRYRYSTNSLRALRHKRRFIVPQNITLSRDARRPKIPTLKPNPPTLFSALALPKELLDALESLSLKTATSIQATAIPYARLGGDLVAQATSGTGKTLTYALVALDSILPATSAKSALIIVPVRELASQVAEVVARLAKVRVVTLVGGTKESIDEERLSKPVNVVVGTPGRVEAMVSRGALNVAPVKVLVLDEADRLLDGSFGGSVERICNMLPLRQTLALSATFSYSFKISLLEVMREPAWIGGSQVVHSVIQLKDACYDLPGKIGAVKSLLQRVKFTLCVVFFNAKKAATRISKNLTKAFSFQTKLIHADMFQAERDAVIRDVRQGNVRVLVTTDVLARGIDFDSCDLVIHMDVPHRAETYLHRVGRTGRFGREGSSLLLFDDVEVSAVRALEEDLGYTIGSQLVLDGERRFKPPETLPKKPTSSNKPFPSGNRPLFENGGIKNKEERRHDSDNVSGESPVKPPESLSNNAANRKRRLPREYAPAINRGGQKNEEGRQPDSHNVSGERSKTEAKESDALADISSGEKVQPESENRKMSLEQVRVLSDSSMDAKAGSSHRPVPVTSPLSIEENIPRQAGKQNSTAANQITQTETDNALQHGDKPEELSLSFTSKRPKFPEEPDAPAKKRKSARLMFEDAAVPVKDHLSRTNAETVAKLPKSRGEASIILRKRQHKWFEWQKSALQQNSDRDAPKNEEASRFASCGTGNIERSGAPRDRIVEQTRQSRGPGTETGQGITARERDHTDDTNRNETAASAYERAQAEVDPPEDILPEQHVSNDEDVDVEPMQTAPRTEDTSAECREAWDRYAEDAYNMGYREAYQEAFRMAQQIRQRLEGVLQ